MLNDLRYALRSFLKNPEFALACIVTLGLGIGANTAIFSVVDAVLLRRAPFADTDRLAMIWETDRNTATTREPGSFPDYLDIKERARSFAATAALMADEMNLTPAAGDPRRIPILRVTHDLLPMLGLSRSPAAASRQSDEVPGGAGRVLISESLWEREFSRSPLGHRQPRCGSTTASYRHRRDAARRGFRRAADPVPRRLLALFRRSRRAYRDRDLDGAPRRAPRSCRAAPIPSSWSDASLPGSDVDAAQADADARHVRARERVPGERRERRVRGAASPTWCSGRSGRRSICSSVRWRSCCWWRA